MKTHIVIILFVVGLLGAAPALAGTTGRTAVKHYLEAGQEAFDAGNFVRAEIDFKKAMMLDRQNREARDYLALLGQEPSVPVTVPVLTEDAGAHKAAIEELTAQRDRSRVFGAGEALKVRAMRARMEEMEAALRDQRVMITQQEQDLHSKDRALAASARARERLQAAADFRDAAMRTQLREIAKDASRYQKELIERNAAMREDQRRAFTKDEQVVAMKKAMDAQKDVTETLRDQLVYQALDAAQAQF